MAAQRDTVPAPHCTCMGDILEKLEALQESVNQVKATQNKQGAAINLINNYLHDRQIRAAEKRETERLAALPPVFEPVPDDDTPTNPGR
jgi:hypothetical protein